MNKTLLKLIFLFIILGPSDLFSEWIRKPFSQKAFVENLGQFTPEGATEAILYGYQNCGTGIFITRKGIYWESKRILQEPENEKELENAHRTVQRSFIFQEFIGASPLMSLENKEQTSDYYTYYSVPDKMARAYKTLIFKNIYPQIDLIFQFHPVEGIKYSFNLHPGADPTNIQFRYNGQDNISIKNRDLILQTICGPMIDHAPVSFYADTKEPISSDFYVNRSSVGFKLKNFDRTREAVIDPWTVTPTGMTVDMKVFEVDFDKYGNIYASGGHGNYKIQKYTPTGTLLWTYNSPFGSLSSTNSTYGDLAVSRSGFCYLTEGFGTRGRAKISPNGIQIWEKDQSNSNSPFFELFHVAFNPTYTKLVVGGRQGNGGDLCFLDTLNGNILGTLNVGNSEVRSMCIAPNGNVYGLTCITVSGVGGNYLFASSPALMPTSFVSVNDGYAWEESGVAYSNGNTIFGPGWSGQNGIAANNCYIYTTRGAIVDRRSLSTGLTISSTVIPGGSQEQNSGIAIDSCGFIYVGSQGVVYKYDENMTAPLAFANTPGPVYDLCVANNGKVIAGGAGFLASFDNLNACNYLPYSCPSLAVPIDLLDFKADKMNGKNLIRWSISENNQSKKFTIQKSSGDMGFRDLNSISRVPDKFNYSYIDEESSSTAYYRIKIETQPGHYDFSEVKEIRGKTRDFSIQPNPLSSGSELEIHFDDQLQNGTIKIMDVFSKVLFTKPFTEENGDHIKILLNLPPGNYIMQVEEGSGMKNKLLLIK